jgi:hypothetical protein
MKNNKKSVYLRYEFSDEKGQLEGGDIFELDSLKEAQNMTAEILKVAHGDAVAVNVTIGLQAPFMGFLKNVGLTQKDIDAETVTADSVTLDEGKPSKKSAPKKKAAKKGAKKTASKKKAPAKAKSKTKTKAKAKKK